MEEFLNPDVLRSRLIAASLYIAGFELLEDTVVNRIRDFYIASPEFKASFLDYGRHYRNYEAEVLSKDKNQVRASLSWLRESEAISDTDVATFGELADLRNVVVHELGRKLANGLPARLAQRFAETLSLLDKIERWWIKNVEIPTDPQLRGGDIDESAILPGPTMMLRLMVDVALGPDEAAKKYLNEFLRQTRRPQ